MTSIGFSQSMWQTLFSVIMDEYCSVIMTGIGFSQSMWQTLFVVNKVDTALSE